MRVFVVRHACAGRKEEWPGHDVDRPLDPVGPRQAEALADVLERHSVGRLVSSPSRRCVDTLFPLARRLGRRVERAPSLEARRWKPALATLIADRRLHRAVLCTHREVMLPFLEELWASGSPVPRPESGEELLFKGTAWSLEVRGGRVASLEQYVPTVRPECGHQALAGQVRGGAAERFSG